jgi:hypothetical protein
MALNQGLAHAHDHLASDIEGANAFLSQWSIKRGSSHGLKNEARSVLLAGNLQASHFLVKPCND